MKRIVATLVTATLLLAGCVSTNRRADNVCPEHASLKCLTEVKCDLDEERGCSVCYCHNAPGDTESVSSYETGGYDDEKGGP